MAWRYENPGYRELLVVPGHTVECDSTKSKTGYAFWQNYRSKSFDIPLAKEIWVKFDVYSASGTSHRWRAYQQASNGNIDGISKDGNQIAIWTIQDSSNPVARHDVKSWTGLHTIILHMVSDASNGIVEYFFDGEKAASVTDKNINNGNSFNNFFLESDGSDILFSNVIISDTELTADDTCDLSKKQWIQPVIGKNGTFGVDDFAVRRSDNSSGIYKVFDATGTNYGTRKGVYFSIAKNVTINHICVMFFPTQDVVFYNWCLSCSDDDKTYTLCQKIARDTSSYYLSFTSVPYHKYYFISLQNANGEVVENAIFDGIVIDAIESDTEKNIFFDTRCNVSNAITQSSDTARHLVESLSTQQDTARAITTSAVRYADTSRVLSSMLNMSDDTRRAVSRDIVINADTVRMIAENIDVDMTADTARNLYRVESMLDDTTRKISNLESVNADVHRTVSRDAIDMLDTVRTLTHTAGLAADTARDVSRIITVNADTARVMDSSTITLHADTSRQIANGTAVTLDTARNISLTLALSVDLSRDTGKIGFDADTQRDVYISQIDVSEDTIRRMPYLIDNKMIQSVTLTIEEHTVSDKMDMKLVGANYMPKDSVRGKFLDYPYNMMILSTTQDKDGIVQTISALYDYYKFNMSRYDIDIYGDDVTPSAAQIISRVASSLGYKSYINITNFTPSTTGQKNNKVQNPYPSILSDIIGWTQQLPWREINIFLHGDTLYAIQRGNEPNVVDMTGRHITRPNITRTIFSGNAEIGVFQYMYGKGGKVTRTDELSEYGKKLKEGWLKNFYAPPGISYDKFGNISYYSGTVTYHVEATDENGEDASYDEDHYAEFDVSYTYDNDGNITSKTETTKVFSNWGRYVIDTWTNTENYADNRNTFYTLTNGDDAIIGTHPGRPSNVFNPGWTERITFSKSGGQTYFVFNRMDAYGNYIGKEEVNGDNVGSTPFPLYTGSSVMDYLEHGYYNEQKRYFNDLKNHVGMIQETLTFDIVDPVAHGDTSGIHVIDLRDKIRLDGKIYYLVRNVVSMTSKQLKQSLEIVRWF